MRTVELLNHWSSGGAAWAVSHLLGTAAVLGLVALVWLLIRRRSSAALGCWLFLFVLLKPLIPFHLPVPQGWLLQGAGEPAAASIASSAATGAGIEFEAAATVSQPLAETTAAALPGPALAARESLSWQSYLLLGWALVVVTLAMRFLFQQLRVHRWLRPASRLDELEGELAELASQIGLRRKVRAYSNPRIETPLVCGLVRPSLMLPEGFGEGLNPDQRRWVLLHELAHVKRGDLWVLAFQRVVQIAFFFNPSVWIANRAINRLREYACDDIALVHAQIDRRSCGEGFLRLVEGVRSQPMPGAAALALFERRSDSTRRLARILDQRRRLVAGVGAGGILVLTVLGVISLPGLRAQEAGVEAEPGGDQRAIPAEGDTLANPDGAGKTEKKMITTKFVEIDQGKDPNKYTHRLAVAQPGIVKEVLVKPGAAVKKGQVLLRLDARQAEAALEVAQIRAAGLEKELVQKKAALDAEMEKAKRLLKIEGGERPGWLEKAIENYRMESGMPGAETRLAIAQAELKQAMVRMEQFSVVAPVDGKVATVNPKLGEYVTPEKPVILLHRNPVIGSEIRVIREEKRR